MPEFTPSPEDIESHRQYLESHTKYARESFVRSLQSMLQKIQQYAQQAEEHPEFTWNFHEEMQRSFLWNVHNTDLGRFMRSAADLMAWDERFPRVLEEPAPETCETRGYRCCETLTPEQHQQQYGYPQASQDIVS